MIIYEYKNLFSGKQSDDPGAPGMDEKWGWISMIDRLSNGDITKHEQIYEMNFIYCLNLLGFYHDRDKYIEAVNKRNEMNNKNRKY